MFAETRNHLDAGVLPLLNAVFCLDCEVISSSRGDECPACKSRALDVYKRQQLAAGVAHELNTPAQYVSVSYTHLDVYKRQG